MGLEKKMKRKGKGREGKEGMEANQSPFGGIGSRAYTDLHFSFLKNNEDVR